MKDNPLFIIISFGATTFIYQKNPRTCPTAIISEIHINVFWEHDYGGLYTFSSKWRGSALCKMFLLVCTKLWLYSTALHRIRQPCCSVAEQHANTQSFICKADGSVMWYPSTLVMVWVPGFLIPGSRAKMESISIYCVFQLFYIPK